jgi:hypothetical protein
VSADLFGLQELALGFEVEPVLEGVHSAIINKVICLSQLLSDTMPNRTSTLNLQTLPAIYYAIYWFGVFTFAFAMLFTLPSFDD